MQPTASELINVLQADLRIERVDTNSTESSKIEELNSRIADNVGKLVQRLKDIPREATENRLQLEDLTLNLQAGGHKDQAKRVMSVFYLIVGAPSPISKVITSSRAISTFSLSPFLNRSDILALGRVSKALHSFIASEAWINRINKGMVINALFEAFNSRTGDLDRRISRNKLVDFFKKNGDAIKALNVMQYSQITPAEVIEIIKLCPNLNSLTTDVINWMFIAELRNIPFKSLTTLKITSTLDDSLVVNMAHLLPNLPNLSAIRLRVQTEVPDQSIALLARSLATLPKLTDVDLSWRIFTEFLKRGGEVNLTSLTLSNNKMEDQAIETLAKVLSAMKEKLEVLKMDSCDITPNGVALLASTFSLMTQLTTISLSRNNLDENNVKFIVNCLVEAREKLPNLTTVNLGGNIRTNQKSAALTDASKKSVKFIL